MFSLHGLNALITGASGGIGAAVAEALARQGANIALSGTRLDALEQTRDRINSLNTGVKVDIFPCKLSDSAAVEQLIPSITEQMGDVHILVNNAGITRDALTIRMTDDQWQDIIDINLTACFRLSRAAVKAMTSKRFGRIINMSSVVATMGNAGQSNYCASKAALIGMTKAMAHETAKRGVTINAIAPGFISTPMTEIIPENIKERLLSAIPTARMGNPEDIAAAVVFLASHEASYITGQTIHVNGGLDMV